MNLAKDVLQVEKVREAPVLSTSCSIVVSIINAVQTSKHDNARMRSLAHSCAAQIFIIADTMRGKWDSAPDELKQHILEFESVLRDVLKIAIKLSKFSRIHLLLRDNEKNITGLETRLASAHRTISISIFGVDAPAVISQMRGLGPETPYYSQEPPPAPSSGSIGLETHSRIQNSAESVRKLCILSLDGGGVRGLSSLIILREIMQAAQLEAKKPDLRPCDIFDLIVGTGTGGISAILLGRMRLTVDEAIAEYVRMAENVFRPPYLLSQLNSFRPMFDPNALTDFLDTAAQEHLGDSEALFFEPTSPGVSQCSSAVLAATSANLDAPPFIFRSYASNLHLKVSEVARATSATAGMFPPVSLGNPAMRFLDAGTAGYNNPTEIALDEARVQWPGRSVGLVLSIGTGSQRIVDASQDKLAELAQKLMTGCEAVHDRVFRRFFPKEYFRFCVPQGLEDIGGMAWTEEGLPGRVTEIASAYLRKAEPSHNLTICVRSILETSSAFPTPGTAAAIYHPPGAAAEFYDRTDYHDILSNLQKDLASPAANVWRGSEAHSAARGLMEQPEEPHFEESRFQQSEMEYSKETEQFYDTRNEPAEFIEQDLSSYGDQQYSAATPDTAITTTIEIVDCVQGLETQFDDGFDIMNHVNHYSLGIRSGRNRDIRLADAGYITQDGDFEFVENLYHLLSSESGEAPLCERNIMSEEDDPMEGDTAEEMVESSGKAFKRYNLPQKVENCSTECHIDYTDLDEKHAWTVLQQEAPRIIETNALSIAPNQLRLVISIYKQFRANIRINYESAPVVDTGELQENVDISLEAPSGLPTLYRFEEGPDVSVQDSADAELDMRVYYSFSSVLDEESWDSSYGPETFDSHQLYQETEEFISCLQLEQSRVEEDVYF